jgi:hypothetical protein
MHKLDELGEPSPGADVAGASPTLMLGASHSCASIHDACIYNSACLVSYDMQHDTLMRLLSWSCVNIESILSFILSTSDSSVSIVRIAVSYLP